MTFHRALIPIVFLVLFWAGAAAASPDFPGLLQENLDMPCVPQCTLCHRDANGGRGTAIRPFAVTMIEEGLIGSEKETLRPALDGVEEGGYDSDGDGTGDLDELRDGANPNQEGDGLLCAQYGCGARMAPDRGSFGTAALIVALILGLGLLRFRLRKEKSRPG